MPSFEELPPEVQAVIAEQQKMFEQRQMEHHDNMNKLNDFLFGLSQDHSFTLALLLGMVGDSTKPAETANYFEGLVRGLMAATFSVCPTHGINHLEHDLAQMSGGTDSGDKEGQTYPTGPAPDDLHATWTEMAQDVKPLADVPPEVDTEVNSMIESSQLMDDLQMYRVGFIDEIDVETDESFEDLRTKHPVTCINCGQQYPSLSDRMLAKSDDCPGCHLKSAHG